MLLPPLQSETVRKLIEKTTKKKDEDKVCASTVKQYYIVKESRVLYHSLLDGFCGNIENAAIHYEAKLTS